MLKYCLHRCKTQEICNKAVDAYLPTLEFVLDWFVTSKIIKKRDHDLFTNNDIIFINEDSSYVTCLSDELDIISVDFTNINADDVNFGENDPETIKIRKKISKKK